MFKLKKLAMVILPLTIGATSVCADTLANNRLALPNPGLSLVSKAKFVGHANPNTKISFTVWLKLRNQKQLEQVAHDIYDPHSPTYQKPLSHDELSEHYLPTKDTINTVQQYFIAHGMQAEIVGNNLKVTGTAKQVEQVFQVQINNYKYKSKTVYANATAPTMDAKLGKYVSGITGLSNIPRFHPAFQGPPKKEQGIAKGQSAEGVHDINLAWNSFVPAAKPTTTSLGGFDGNHLQYTYELRNIAPVNGTAIDGTGQTIVILDACDTYTPEQIVADANLYNNQGTVPILPLTLGTNFTVVHPDGSPFTDIDAANCNGGTATEWATEQALDVQSSHTIAPGAKIVLVLAPVVSNVPELDTAAATLITTLTTPPAYTIGGFSNAYVVSNSWLAQESAGEALEGPLLTASTYLLSFNFATGDCGDNVSGDSDNCTGTLSTNYPATSTYATAVGGTSLFVDDAWQYAFESGWGTNSYDSVHMTSTFQNGSGGGVSAYYGPASWQSPIYDFTAGGYGLISDNGNRRSTPDISMLGDQKTGLNIVVNGATLKVGGTSLATPLFSATLALVYQARSLWRGAQSPLGLMAPYLYNNQPALVESFALKVITPPHQAISGAFPVSGQISAFRLDTVIYNLDSSLTIPESQFWNDVVGLGSPYLPTFIDLWRTV